MKFYRVRALFIVLVRCPVLTPVRMPTMNGLPLSQSDQRISSVFQSVYNSMLFHMVWMVCKLSISSSIDDHAKDGGSEDA